MNQVGVTAMVPHHKLTQGETVSNLSELRSELLQVQIAQKNEELLAMKRVNQRDSAKGQEHGSYQYVGPVEEGAVHLMIGELATWSRANPGAPLTLTFNSQGGAAFDGFALFDFLRGLRAKGHKVTTAGLGLVASMGSVLLQAGDHRVMAPRSWMLIHEIQGVVAGNFSKMEDDMKFNKRLQDQALAIYLERSTWTKAKLVKHWTRKDFWLSPDEALAAGFIDEISDIDAGIVSDA